MNSKEYTKIKKGELALRSIFIIWYGYFADRRPHRESILE